MFKDRIYAGYLLTKRLYKFKGEDCVVVAVPRGGVSVAYQVAKHLEFPLDIILTKKIGHPTNKEYAIGSVSSTDRILNEYKGFSETYVEEETNRLRQEIKEKEQLYRGKRKALDLKDKTVLLIDDGIATGKTVLLTIKMLRSKQPKYLVIAVPVLPHDQIKEISRYVDELVYIVAPYDFNGVGHYYENFDQVTDEEVIRLLNDTRND